MAAEDAFITFSGKKVRVKVVEPATDIKHRVFVTSSPMTSAFNWRKITPELTQLGCVVVLMDMPGFGMSDCGDNAFRSAKECAGMGWGIADEIDSAIGNGEGIWHLIGHGTACQTVLAMANMHPDSVNSQVYISPMMNTENGIRTGLTSHSRWYDANIVDPKGYRALMDKLLVRQTDDYVLDIMREPFKRRAAKTSFMDMLAHKAAPEPLKGFAPALALWGDKDILLDEKARAAFKRLVPEAETHIMKSAGHMPMETNSHAMRDYLRGWIKYIG